MSRSAVATAVIAVLAAAAGVTVAARSTPPSSGAATPPGPSPTWDPATARTALSGLVVAERHRGGYHRDLFGDGWTITDGCTTRQHVLADEAVTGHRVGCDVVGGDWVDWYTPGAPHISDSAQLDIDHLVPLAHAWQAGAWAWDPQQRLAFANDLTNPATLTAVSATENRAKADAPPDAWQPPNRSARCAYAIDWIATKTAWALTVTRPELDALDRMLDTCPTPSTSAPAGT